MRLYLWGQRKEKRPPLVISTIADTLTRGFENVTDTVSGTFFEPTIRLGVTGLARSGKTVFITSLVANLMDRGRMPGLLAQSEGRILSAYLQPQPDDTLPRFDYESHLGDLTARDPHWPDSTRTISELRPGCVFGDLFGHEAAHDLSCPRKRMVRQRCAFCNQGLKL